MVLLELATPAERMYHWDCPGEWFGRPAQRLKRKFGEFDDLFDSHFDLLNPDNILKKTKAEDRHLFGCDQNRFDVSVDVKHFAPEEVLIKIVDRNLVVQALHEERREQNGWIKRQFTKRYLIPDNCDVDSFNWQLSSSGVLSISARLWDSHTTNLPKAMQSTAMQQTHLRQTLHRTLR